MILKTWIKRWLVVMMILSPLLLNACAGSPVIIAQERIVKCPDDVEKPCLISRAWLRERFEVERGLVRQIEECRNR